MKNNKRVIPIILILALFLVVPVFAWSSNLETDLKVYFPLDNGTDYKGIHNLTGNATFSEGKINNGSNFADQFSQYLEDGSADDLNFGSGNFSINFWVKPNGTRTNDRVLAFTSNPTVDGYFFSFDSNTMYFYQGTGQINQGSVDPIQADVFTMVTLVKDELYTKMYINGSNSEGFSVGAYDLINVTDGNLTLGMGTREYPSFTFHGMLDEVGIWGKALNQDEVDELYNLGLGINPQTNRTLRIITLETPLNNALLSSSQIQFYYNISETNLTNTTLYLFNSTELFGSFTNSTLTDNARVGFNINIEKNDNYTWYATATNVENNVTQSENRIFQLSLKPAQAPVITNIYPTASLTSLINNSITISWRIDKKNRNIVNSSLYIYNLSGYSDRYTATDFIYTNLTGGDTGNTNHTFVYVNHTFTASQNYTFFIDVINTAGNKSFATNKTINITLVIPPLVILKSPLDLEIFNISNITFNYNISGTRSIKNSTLFIYNSTGGVTSRMKGSLPSNSVVFWNITLYSDNFTWFADVYDIENRVNVSANRTFQIILPQENIFAPIITLKTPENNSLLNESLAQFNYNITDTNLTNSTLYLYNSTDFINSYFTAYTEAEVYINETLTDENYTWFVTASNLANNITQSENWTFQRFTPYVVPPSPIFPPIIILKSPLNTAQLNYTSITFNYNISDTNVTNSTLYLYDDLGFVNSYFTAYTEAEVYLNETLPNQNYSWFVMGSNSANNISTSGNSTFQIYTTAIIVPIPPQMTGGIIYEVLATSGAGIGIFFQILANALPLLLFGLAIVGIIVIIGHSIIKPLIKAGKL